ncbi:monovalent cation:proton antiporter-2 (CPA2) family protein [Chthonobacter rhizosphaerae]|uniref:monovalent cation:proton antiporter-2 (CPA2) family protein n=1 Tax=Chthonobacter rhizosphaerae TaxID=2735553 RepID=UPI0015EE597D|nr:monovalent cation:proton antiporter-2 (CPA2) family protein [Chthonobacter rhizosphaerae]
MAADGFLVESATYLAAAVASVPIAKRLGLGSVLGYLVAGLVVGPSVLGLVNADPEMMHVAEFGVVMMLFLVGLELQPSRLWQMRGAVFGLGGLQLGVTAVAVAAVALLFGQGFGPSVAIGLILAMSSTAIVLQALAEKGLLKSPPGEATFAVLLFQDIAIIPILAVMPLLGGAGASEAAHADPTLIDRLPGWAAALTVLAAVALIVVAGRLALRPVLDFMATTRLREIFTATALLLVASTALLMQSVGLSPALGAFLAGVVLADSEYRHEIETDIEPFKGLLLGLFFISVGASINVSLVLAEPVLLAALVAGIVALKALVLYPIARAAKLARSDAALMAIALSQIGEFAFVLLSFAGQNRILDGGTGSLLTAAVALSMLTTPVLFILFERLTAGRADRPDDRAPDTIEERNRVIIAGFGRVGQIVGRILIGRGIKVTVLEHDAEQLEALRRFGFKLYYGDARRHDLLHAAGADEASILVVATDDKDTTAAIIEMARRNFPHLKIIARAFDRPHAYELEALGADSVVRETFAGSIEMGTETLKALGLPGFESERIGRIFRRHDTETMRILREIRGKVDRDAYGLAFRERREMLANVLQRDFQTLHEVEDAGWDAESLREEVRGAR